MAEIVPPRGPGRRFPSHDFRSPSLDPKIHFVTVCTHQRQPWLTQRAVQTGLEAVWKKADTWLVGHYLLMPDHLHLFCSPRDLQFSLSQWIGYWKSASI